MQDEITSYFSDEDDSSKVKIELMDNLLINVMGEINIELERVKLEESWEMIENMKYEKKETAEENLMKFHQIFKIFGQNVKHEILGLKKIVEEKNEKISKLEKRIKVLEDKKNEEKKKKRFTSKNQVFSPKKLSSEAEKIFSKSISPKKESPSTREKDSSHGA